MSVNAHRTARSLSLDLMILAFSLMLSPVFSLQGCLSPSGSGSLVESITVDMGDQTYRATDAQTASMVDRGVVDRGVVDRGVVDRGVVDRGVIDLAFIDQEIFDRGAESDQFVSDMSPDLDLDLSPPDLDLDMSPPDLDLDMTPPDLDLDLDLSPPNIDLDLSPPNIDLALPDMMSARCGDGRHDEAAGEACDDGNSNTEACEYGELSCLVCDARCQLVPGETRYCGDRVITDGERCDDGLANSDQASHGCRTDCHPDYRDMVLPFLQANYIVQGVASSCETLETQDCIEERLYLSFYFKDAEGNTVESAGFEDRLGIAAELDPNSEPPFKLTRCWRLSGTLGTSHLGGAAYAETTAGRRALYVSGAGRVGRFELPSLSVQPELELNDPRYGAIEACPSLDASAEWSVAASSFVSHVKVGGEDRLLVGRFCSECTALQALITDCDPDCPRRAYTYALDMDTGAINPDETPTTYLIRVKAQGVDIEGDHLYVSTSYGDNDSALFVDSLSDARCLTSGCGAAEVVNQRRLTVKGGVAGMEDLARVGGHLWTASESGSRHFQNRALGAWSSYFPYLFDIGINDGLNARATAPDEAYNSYHTYNVTTLLSGVFGAWWERYRLIRVLDVNGDGRDDVVLGPDPTSGCWHILEGGSARDRVTIMTRECVVTGYAGWWNNPERIHVLDANGDGRDDLVIGPYSADGCWYALEGASTSAGADLIDRGCIVEYKGNWHDKAERIRPLDMNGDGAEDLLIGPSSAGAWYLLQGRAGGSVNFSAGRTLAFSGYGTWWDNAERIRVIDANGDGRDDLIVGPYSVDGCWYLLQADASAPPNFIDRGCVVQGYADWYSKSERFYIDDFTGDAREDLLIGPSGSNGNWYLLRGEGIDEASLSDRGPIHQNYRNWYDNDRRIHVTHPASGYPAGILIGPERGSGEWHLLRGYAQGMYDKQWMVNTKENWGAEDSTHKPERIRALDLDGDGADEILIGPSDTGTWSLVEPY